MVKGEIIEDVNEKEKYPYLGMRKLNGKIIQIVLFVKENSGTLIIDTDGRNIGYYSTNWGESLFEIFEGKLTLETC